MPDYQKIAGDLIFGGEILDNAARGIFIEALIVNALKNTDQRWFYAGQGWGPWDLQRGTGESGDRVRFQVKVKATKQLWKCEKEYRAEFNLGLKTREAVPSYFARDFPAKLFGTCEPSGYRTDYFLFAWHDMGSQSDPLTYDFYIVPAHKIEATAAGLAKKIAVERIRNEYARIGFADLPAQLNAAADGFQQRGH